jgi:hypothetical protein
MLLRRIVIAAALVLAATAPAAADGLPPMFGELQSIPGGTALAGGIAPDQTIRLLADRAGELVEVTRLPGGTWQDPVSVGATGGIDAIAESPSTTAALVSYIGVIDGETSLGVSLRTPGRAWTFQGLAPFRAVQAPSFGGSAVAVADDGHAVAAWLFSDPGSGRDVMSVSAYEHGAWQTVAGATSTTEHYEAPKVAVRPDGAALVTWKTITAVGAARIDAAVEDPGGSWSQGPVFTGAADDAVLPTGLPVPLAANPIRIVFTQAVSAAPGQRQVLQQLTRAGAGWSQAPIAFQLDPVGPAALGGSATIGGAAVAWQTVHGVNGALWNATTWLPDSAFGASTPGGPAPVVAVNDSGDAVAAGTGSGGITFAVGAHGGEWHPSRNYLGVGLLAAPSVAIDPLGDGVLVTGGAFAILDVTPPTVHLEAPDTAAPGMVEVRATASDTLSNASAPTIDWGDGSPETACCQHTYGPGTFTITARSRGTWGNLGTAQRQITIVQGPHVEPFPAGNRTLTVDPAGGHVTSSPPGLDCSGGPCSAAFPWHTSVSLSVTPAPGRRLTAFTGDCSGTDCTVVLDRDSSVAVAYEALSYRVSVTVRGPGVVAIAPDGPNPCHVICRFLVPSGRSLTATSHPGPGAVLSSWSGSCSARTIRCSLQVTTGPAAFSASFTQVTGLGSVHLLAPRALEVPGRATAAARLRIALLDRKHHVQAQRTVSVRPGRFSVHLSLPQLPAGSYTLRVSGDSNRRPLGATQRTVRLPSH